MNELRETLAHKLGTTAHISPLLMKAKRLGLDNPARLEALAISRGCSHYEQPNQPAPPAVSENEFSNEELSAALLSLSLPYSPHSIRLGAAMLGADGNEPEELARLAVRERCETPMRYVAESALRFEPENPFWRALLAGLPKTAQPKSGVFPHPTRFVSMTGMTRAGIGTVTVWLRPIPAGAARE